MMLNISQIFLYGARKRLDYSKKIKYEEEDGIDYGICNASEIILIEGRHCYIGVRIKYNISCVRKTINFPTF